MRGARPRSESSPPRRQPGSFPARLVELGGSSTTQAGNAIPAYQVRAFRDDRDIHRRAPAPKIPAVRMLVQPIVAPLIQMVRNTRCCFTGGSKLRSFSYSALVVSLALLGSAMPATAAAGGPPNALEGGPGQAPRARGPHPAGGGPPAPQAAPAIFRGTGSF